MPLLRMLQKPGDSSKVRKELQLSTIVRRLDVSEGIETIVGARGTK